MKHKLKNYLKLGILLFGISALFTNCMDDSIEIEKSKTDKYSISRIGSKEFVKNSVLTEKLASIGRGIRQTSDNTYPRYDNVQFSLNLNEATYIEATDGSYHSYTFGIYNEDDNYNINNIVLSLTENGDYEADLVTYTLTQEERSLIDSGIKIDLSDKTTIEPFDIDQISTYGRGGTCTEFVEVDRIENCSSGHNVSSCTTECCGHCYDYVYEWQEIPCDGGGSGSGSTGSTPGGTTGDPGTSGGTTSTSGPKATALTSPENSNVSDIETLENDCLELGDLSENTNFQTRIDELIIATSGNKEILYYGIKNNGTMDYADSDRLEGPADEHRTPDHTISNAVDSCMHNHFGNSLSVFSPEDLHSFYKLYEAGLINVDNFTLFVVSPGDNVLETNDDTLYAITITNETQFQVMGNLWLSDLNIISHRYNDINNKIHQDISTSINEKRFVKLLNQMSIGLTVYRGDTNNLNLWTQLKYDPDSEILKENPCN